MHEESLYNSGCDSWIKQQAWLISFYLCFLYTCLCVWYTGMHMNGRGSVLGSTHVYGSMCIGRAELSFVPPSWALHLMYWVHISHLTLELAILDILARQLLQGLSFLYVLSLQVATGPVQSYAGAWDLNSGSHFLLPTPFLSLWNELFQKSVRPLLYRELVSFPLNKAVDGLENDSLAALVKSGVQWQHQYSDT